MTYPQQPRKFPYTLRRGDAIRRKSEQGRHQDALEIVRALEDIAQGESASLREMKGREWWKGFREWSTIILIFPTAAIALATLVVTHRDTISALEKASIASSAAQKQADIAKDTEETQLRAYLYVRPDGVTYTDLSADPVTVKLTPKIVGSGSTPANRIANASIARAFTYPLPDPFDLPLDYLSTPINAIGDLLPTEPENLLSEVTTELSKAEIGQMIAGKRLIYLYGVLQYQDIFGQYWSVRYCFYYDWEAISGTGIPGVCPFHNQRSREVVTPVPLELAQRMMREKPTMRVHSFIRLPPRSQ